MPTNYYDVITIGDDLAGLIAATLCARRGLRVLIAETAVTPPERYALGPYTLPRAPLAFVGETSPAVRRVIAELNFMQVLRRRLTPLRPSFQVILPDARLDIGLDADANGRELARELPAEREALEAFFGRAAEASKLLDPVLGQDISFPPEGFWERRELGRSESRVPGVDEDLLPGIPLGHRARALVSLPAAFSLGCDPRAASPMAIMRAFDLWRRGAARLEGGRETLRQMLLEKMRTQHAGEIRAVVPGSVVTRWGRATGLTLRDRDETLGAANLISAAPIAECGDLFGEKRPKKIFQLQRAILPTAYRYVLNLVVSEAGIPEGIAPISFVVNDPAQPLIGDNAFAIHVGEADEQARVVVTLVANAPAPQDGENLDDIMSQLRGRLRRRLEEVLPFSGEHTLAVHSPNQARIPEGLEVKDPPPVMAPEPLWTSTLPAALGVGAAPYDVGVKSLTTACSQNLPGLGLEGDFAAGWCAARLVCHAAGKKKDYLKDEVLVGNS